MSTPPESKPFLHTPDEMMQSVVEYAKLAKQGHGVKWSVPSMDTRVIPFRPGELIGIMARPGHGKTSLLMYLAKTECEAIEARGSRGKECVVYVSWEQSVEELTSTLIAEPGMGLREIAWGTVDMERLETRAVQAPRHALWNLHMIGYGGNQTWRIAERMYIEQVLDSVESIERNYSLKPSLVLYDYIQLVPSPTADNRMTQVLEAPIRIKEVAQRLRAPAVAAIQARRDVDDRVSQIPTLRDAQWSSSIEQTCDKLFGIWRPAMTEDPDGFVETDDGTYQVTPELMFIRMLKQRGDQGRFTWALNFNPATLVFSEIHRKRLEI